MSECKHIWEIESPKPGEPYSKARCRLCHETKVFSNWLGQDFRDSALKREKYVPKFLARIPYKKRRHRHEVSKRTVRF